MKPASLPPFLDTLAALEIDKDDLAARIIELPRQITSAVAEFRKIQLPGDIARVREVVFCGMGGSGIGAAVACDLPSTWLRKPLRVINDYTLPAHVGADSLVVVVSYSGDTEETVACWREAKKRGALVVAVAGGGTIAQEASKEGVSLYKFNYKSQPRDAFGYLFAPLLELLVKAGVLEAKEADLGPAAMLAAELTQKLMPQVPTTENQAKQLAYRIFDHAPFIVGSAVTGGVARRWKGQFNEHSKSMSWFDVLPEADHNTIEGFNWPTRLKDDTLVVLLMSSFDHKRVQFRQKALMELLGRQHMVFEVVPAQGDDLWSQKISLIVLGDWVSYYLALLYRTDPEEISAIKVLKGKLAS